MKCLVVVVAVLHTVFAGDFGIQAPYLNSAGVVAATQYAATPFAAAPFAAAPLAAAPLAAAPLAAAPLAAAPAPVSSSYTTSTYYGNGHFLGRLAGAPVAAPHAVLPAAAPIATAQAVYPAAAPVATAHAAFQTAHAVFPTAHHAIAPAAAVVPTVHHVPAVADVPVTKIQAQPGYIHKNIDVVKPAVKTSRYELRRPAIQKEFYDIEERVIVRPAGSALVELDQPHSKLHKSSSISPLGPVHVGPTHIVSTPIAASPAPPAFIPSEPTGFIPAQSDFGISDQIDQGITTNDDSIVVEARRLSQSSQQSQQSQQAQQSQSQQEFQARSRVEQQVSQRNSLPENQILTHTQAFVRSRPQTRQDQSTNQEKLIELLTAREGIANVGFNSPSSRNVGDAGTVRARVLSAELASRDAPVTGERVNTRRVVVSRPTETVEEVDVLEPVTKLERVAVQHPAVFKSLHVGYERVPTSVPVLTKTATPLLTKAVAPAVYSHAPIYY